MPSHYLNQCWNTVNWILRNKLQWDFNRKSNIFKKMHLKTSGKCWSFCLDLSVLKNSFTSNSNAVTLEQRWLPITHSNTSTCHILKYIFWDGNFLIVNTISLEYFTGCWHLPSDKMIDQHATSHYLNQCWPRCLTSNGNIRPQRVNPSHTYYEILHANRINNMSVDSLAPFIAKPSAAMILTM